MALRQDKIVIDVSKWQGVIDWNKVKETPGLVGVILRAGYTNSKNILCEDPYFRRNYTACKEEGIPVGTYIYVNGTTKNILDAVRDAEETVLSARKFELPVYLDIEEKIGNIQSFTRMIDMACQYLEAAHYYVGIYGSDINTFRSMIDGKYLTALYTSWVARYGKEPTYISNYILWQYTDHGKINGINGDVDISYCTDAFINTINAIKKRRFNNL